MRESLLPDIRLRNIGFIFQGFNFFPALTAQQNVEISLGLKGVRSRQARIEARRLLESVGLADKLKSYRGLEWRAETARRPRPRVGRRSENNPR